MSLPQITMTGNLVRDPEVRFTSSGTAVAGLTVATNRYTKTDSGWDVTETCFLEVDIWGAQGELAGDSLAKGDKVMIQGTLKQDTWEKDGSTRSKHKVNATAWALVPKRKETTNDVF